MTVAHPKLPVLASAIVVSIALAACASSQSSTEIRHGAGNRPAGASSDRVGFEQIGVASWYGARYHGRSTASGERFDMNALTAAHRTLPFGTRVRVTNLGNGRSVVVRINDRGPFVTGRIIDVSRSAAERLGFTRQGVARVEVRVVRPT